MKVFSNNQAAPLPPQDQPGSWNERKDKLKDRFPILTDNDLVLGPDNRAEMFGNLLNKLGKTTEEMHAIIIALWPIQPCLGKTIGHPFAEGFIYKAAGDLICKL